MAYSRDMYRTQGNTVLQPQYDPQIKTKEQILEDKRLKEQIRKTKQSEINERNKKKIQTMAKIAVVSVMLFSTTARASQLYSYQKDYTNLQKEARIMDLENEANSALIITNSGIGNVAVKAKELGMVEQNDENTFYVDMTKNNFSEDAPVEQKSGLFKSIIETLGIG